MRRYADVCMLSVALPARKAAVLAHHTTQSSPDADTFYQLLGIDFRATPAQVTKAYRRRMKECHPDRLPPEQRKRTEQLCQRINYAYTVLKDPNKRRQYDQSIRAREVQDQIMNRYVGGFGGPGLGGQRHDPHAAHLRRARTEFEKAEQRQTSRAAMLSLFGAFVLMTVVAFGLLLVFAMLSTIAGLLL